MTFRNKAIYLIGAMSMLWHGATASDDVPHEGSGSLQWEIGAAFSPAFVPGTNDFLKGGTNGGYGIKGSVASALRAGFRFSPYSREGMLYPGLYQGLGVGVRSFMSRHDSTFAGTEDGARSTLGTPVSVYVYQGAPIVHFSRRLWLGYEWEFGAAFGWNHYQEEINTTNTAVSTSVTAHIGLGLKLHYMLSDRWQISAGLDVAHFSNGNTSWPNSGVNTMGGTLGVTYLLNPQPASATVPRELEEEADKGEWFYDITAYGAWRKRSLVVDSNPVLCPGKFGVAGLQVAPMRKFNRWVAAGVSLDMQFDESAGLAPYWVEGSYDENVKFHRPPFGKQLGVGLSAHAELTMPIFSVNAGLGLDILNPEGEERFYQSLTLKTFLTRSIYLNVGYRLGKFKDPQNLMLGVGIRLR